MQEKIQCSIKISFKVITPKKQGYPKMDTLVFCDYHRIGGIDFSTCVMYNNYIDKSGFDVEKNMFGKIKMIMGSGTIWGYFLQVLPFACLVGIIYFAIRFILLKKAKSQ